MIIFVYVLLCVVVGIAGRERRPGFLGYVLLSLVFTPVITLIFLLVTQKRFLARQGVSASHMASCTHCRHAQRQTVAIAYCTHCGRPL
jgi:hypothetical protein